MITSSNSLVLFPDFIYILPKVYNIKSESTVPNIDLLPPNNFSTLIFITY
nr:MAG TPA: hypothetical protein [Caudoviricetes sp.]